MQIESAIVRVLDVVDRSTRREFPEDYDKRCMYGAFAVSGLLQEVGFPAHITGGSFIALVVSASGDRASMQGFGTGQNGPSHYWTEVHGIIVDLGPHYLPKGSSYPARSMPMVAWRPDAPLPKYLRYRPEIRYAPDVELISTGEIKRRIDVFTMKCLSRLRGRRGQPNLSSWLLTDPTALDAAVKSRNPWAIEMLQGTWAWTKIHPLRCRGSQAHSMWQIAEATAAMGDRLWAGPRVSLQSLRF